MAYSTTDNVQSLIPTTLWNHDASSPVPTGAQVAIWIGEIDREIDSKLSARYVTPITGAESLAIIESISARMTAMRVWGVVFTGQTGAPDVPRDWLEARKLLDAIAGGSANLPDAENLGASTAAAPGAPAGSFRELADDPLADVPLSPPFTMQDVF